MFSKYGISEYKTPMDDRAQYSRSKMPKPGSAEALQVATFSYRELIGTLLWISKYAIGYCLCCEYASQVHKQSRSSRLESSLTGTGIPQYD